jgi:hypothetical protein
MRRGIRVRRRGVRGFYDPKPKIVPSADEKRQILAALAVKPTYYWAIVAAVPVSPREMIESDRLVERLQLEGALNDRLRERIRLERELQSVTSTSSSSSSSSS